MQQAEYRREPSSGAGNRWADLELVRFPIIGCDTMLFRPGSHDHGSPVRTAYRGHHGSRMKRARAILH